MSVFRKFVSVCTGLAFALSLAGAVAAGDNGDQAGSGEKLHPVKSFASGIPDALIAPRTPLVILYDQTDSPNANGFNSQNFESAYDAYDNQAADDFVVSGSGWVVTTVVTPGAYYNGPGPATSVHVTFYDDAGGLPGSIVPGCDYPAVGSFTDSPSGTLTTTLSPACTLSPGTKWVSVQVNMSFTLGGQWGWTERDVQTGNPAVWRNPGDAFGSGCLVYTPRVVCAGDPTAPDHSFRLEGTLAGCTVDADCQDGNLCNGAEVCVAGACAAGKPVVCDDGLFCTIDSCDTPTGTCNHAPNRCGDGDSCSVDSCDEAADACTHVTPPTLHFCSTDAITIPSSGTATPYPSSISVSGLGSIGGLCSVELKGLTHTFPSDIDVLVVGPGTPQNAIVMSDAGGSTGVTGVDLTLKDTAAGPIPTPLVTGTYQPTNSGTGDSFPGAPAPTGGSALSAFDGANPNGTWSVYVVDDASGDSGSFAGGWCVNLVVSGCANDAECNDGNLCNGTETCVAGACTTGAPVNCDDGLFCTLDSCDPSTGDCHHAENSCSDGDSCTSDLCDEAADACTHAPPPTFHFCNTGSISIPSSGNATPYPSTINVSGLGSVGALCSVELSGITHTFPGDIDMLLVGPGTPQNAIVMSDVGGGTAAAGVNLTLKDAAAGAIPSPLVSGTFKPTNLGTGDTFPGAPAPTGGSALSAFDGTNPNGDWSLYVVDDAGGDLGSVSGGWCVNIVINVCTSDAECSDGNACNGLETCVAGACTPGTPVNCDDGEFCTLDSCDTATGDCGHVPNPCDDGDGCTADTCDEAGGVCAHADLCLHVCNTGAITVNDSTSTPTPATPYPSAISVSGAPGVFSLVSVQLLGVTHTFPDDLDVLLAAPNTPTTATLMSDVGGGADAVNVDLTLTDGAPPVPDAGPLVSGVFSPTDVSPGTGTEGWPAPAPAPTGGTALSQFNGTDPNGDWNLYVVDDQSIDSGTINGGWCMNYRFTCTSPADCDDGNPCTVDDCDLALGCVHAPNACDDGNPCTDDSCDPASGCLHADNTNPCDDGNACTTGDSCGGGACTAGDPTNCDDGNCCTVDACDPATGCYHAANTAGPVFTRQPSLGHAILWPPNHGYADFTVADTGAAAASSCGIASIQFASCSSSQPENGTGTGDGNTTRDCAYESGAVHFRAERDGACSPIGRAYETTLVAIDVCGNAATSDPVDVGVWHDRGHAPAAGTIVHAEGNQNDTRAGVNGTYGTDCGAGSPDVNGTIHDHSDADPEMEISQEAAESVGDLRLDKASGGNVRLTWSDPTLFSSTHVTRYHVYRLDPDTLFWTQIAEVPKQSTTYLDPVLGSAAAFQYKVTAVIK
jgi:subtilisin-like proprotein convertase family protein